MTKDHTKNLRIILCLIGAMVLLSSSGIAAGDPQCRITMLDTGTAGRVEVTGDRELDYRFFPLSSPERLVFDFKRAVLDFNGGELYEAKPDGLTIRAVRLSQFSADPEVVRLVIEPSADDPARITRSDEGRRLVIDFGEVINQVTEKDEISETAEADEPAAEESPAVEDETPEPSNEEPARDLFRIRDRQRPAEQEEAPAVVEPEVKAPAMASQPLSVPFCFSNNGNGLAVDVKGFARDDIRVRENKATKRITIEAGETLSKTAPVSLGTIKVASGPISEYETLNYAAGYRLVMKMRHPANYSEEAIPDGVRVIITAEEGPSLKVLASSDETEVAEGTFVFESGTAAAAEKPVIAEIGVAPTPMEFEVPAFMSAAVPFAMPAPTMVNAGTDYSLVVGDMVVIPTKGLQRVSIGNPEVISVNVISQEEILVTAMKEGQSALMTWEADEVRLLKWIEVSSNNEPQSSQLDQLINEPGIKVKIVGDNVILEGTVDTDLQLARAHLIAENFGTKVTDLVEVINPVQVMVKVRVVEIDKKSIDDYFKQISAGARDENGDFKFSIVSAILDPEIPGGGLVSTAIKPAIVNNGIDDMRYDPIDIALDYLESERKANILSEPNLMALHGTAAKFRVGGEIPYTYQNEQGVNVVQFKEFGVELNMTPTVNSCGGIRLDLNPIVRTVDLSLAIAGIPGFRTREMTTTVQLENNQTVVLGGLIQNELTKVVAKIPVLGDIPVLGELFRSKKFQEDATELLIFITPVIVEPEADMTDFVTESMTEDEREALFEKS